jgi:hypothetical protein
MRNVTELARPSDRYFLVAAIGLLLAIVLVVIITQVVNASPQRTAAPQSSVAETQYAQPVDPYTPRQQRWQPSVYYT